MAASDSLIGDGLNPSPYREAVERAEKAEKSLKEQSIVRDYDDLLLRLDRHYHHLFEEASAAIRALLSEREKWRTDWLKNYNENHRAQLAAARAECEELRDKLYDAQECINALEQRLAESWLGERVTADLLDEVAEKWFEDADPRECDYLKARLRAALAKERK